MIYGGKKGGGGRSVAPSHVYGTARQSGSQIGSIYLARDIKWDRGVVNNMGQDQSETFVC